jgi:hypothetical protein
MEVLVGAGDEHLTAHAAVLEAHADAPTVAATSDKKASTSALNSAGRSK